MIQCFWWRSTAFQSRLPQKLYTHAQTPTTLADGRVKSKFMESFPHRFDYSLCCFSFIDNIRFGFNTWITKNRESRIVCVWVDSRRPSTSTSNHSHWYYYDFFLPSFSKNNGKKTTGCVLSVCTHTQIQLEGGENQLRRNKMVVVAWEVHTRERV